MNTEFHTPFELFMQMYIHKIWMEGTDEIPNKNPLFFVTSELNRMGFLPKYNPKG